MPSTEQESPFAHGKKISVCICLLIALLSAAFAFGFKHVCGQCMSAASMEPIPGLSIIGAVFYASLLVATFRHGSNKYTSACLYTAVGVHAGLIWLLINYKLLCIPCITCAAAAAIAAVIAWRSEISKILRTALLSGVILSASAIEFRLSQIHRQWEVAVKETVHFDKWPRERSLPIVVSVYVAEGCPTCKAFKGQQIPELKKRFGDKIVIRYLHPPGPMPVPTSVVGGVEPAIYVGTSDVNPLADAISRNLNEISTRASHSVASSLRPTSN